MATKSIQRTLKYLKSQGFTDKDYEIVEKFNPYAGPHGQRKDLHSIIDITVFVKEAWNVYNYLGIQACGADFSEHVHKIELLDNWNQLRKWLLVPGHRFELWGWRQLLKKKGGKAKEWVPRIKIYTIDDFK